MSLTELHVLERRSQPVRGPARIAPLLRDEMDVRNLTAKELAMQMRAWAVEDPANRWALDYRTIQHAMLGTACALDTYLALSGFFGWDFIETVQTPIHGADPVSAREAEVARQLVQVAALQARVERARALRSGKTSSLDRLAGGPFEVGPRAAGEARAFSEPKADEEPLGPPNLDLFEGAPT